MEKSRMMKTAVLILLAVGIMMIPPPEGLSPTAWKIFAIYISAILGIVLKPFSEPVILLVAIASSSLLLGNLNSILRSGYGSTTTWLVLCAFSFSAAFIKTDLGKRVAYVLVGKLASSTLGMGYVLAFLEFIIAPVTPSGTARSGGIVFPIANSAAVALNSEPGSTARRAGSYFMISLWCSAKTSAYLFLTALAPNALAAKLCFDISKVEVGWFKWFIAASVPGILMLLLIPFLVYLVHKPELAKIDGKSISEVGLKELGPMKSSEKILAGIFILALSGWMFGGILKIGATEVAIVAMCLCLLSNVLTWDDILKAKGGWSTFIWYGGIIGLAAVLSGAKFFEWLAPRIGAFIPPALSGYTALLIIVGLSVVVRYFFASGAAYTASLLPVFLTVGFTCGAPQGALVLALLFSNCYGGVVTHYGGAQGPIIFGAGYLDVKPWWTVGGIIAAVTYCVQMSLGVAWWKFLGYY
ncbi:MAG: anion permease [Desulfovibrio sp.]|jgi:DASS family divalent anion:Na+ symporter|nr:anion permease [Desulfovibrio sp.]